MKPFELIISKDNLLGWIEPKKEKLFLARLKQLCKIIPEFTYQPILYRWSRMWRYDSKHYWQDNLGRCSLQFQNSYFGFLNTVDNYESIFIDCQSFGIKQASDKVLHNFCGVPVDYLSVAQRKRIRKERIRFLKDSCAEIIAELETLKED